MSSDGSGKDQNKSGILRAARSRLGGAGDEPTAPPAGVRPPTGLLRFLVVGAPIELQLLGRVLLHAGLVGVGAGLIGAGFFAALEYVQRLALESLAGYVPLRAYGERFVAGEAPAYFRPWILVFIPAIGALLGGLASRLAPETRGGGGDAMIDALHHHGGVIRRRVLGVKALRVSRTKGVLGSRRHASGAA